MFDSLMMFFIDGFGNIVWCVLDTVFAPARDLLNIKKWKRFKLISMCLQISKKKQIVFHFVRRDMFEHWFLMSLGIIWELCLRIDHYSTSKLKNNAPGQTLSAVDVY